MRCVETDPGARPASAIQVAAALPGGDSLHAALAAGETPSPEMVAAAGSRETWRPAIGLMVLAATVVVLLAGAWGRSRMSVLGRVPLDFPPEGLAHRAREVLKEFGYVDASADSAYGFDYDNEFVGFVQTRVEPAA